MIFKGIRFRLRIWRGGMIPKNRTSSVVGILVVRPTRKRSNLCRNELWQARAHVIGKLSRSLAVLDVEAHTRLVKGSGL